MNRLKSRWVSLFNIIDIEYAHVLGLEYIRNIHGDEINAINCRSLWKNKWEHVYRVSTINK